MALDNEALVSALRAAQERASHESVAWVPEKEGDGCGGEIVGIGRYETQYGTAPFLEVKVPEGITVTMGGKDVTKDGPYFRIGFMGTVMEGDWKTYAPGFGDLVFCQHLGTRKQRNDMNDYKLTQSVFLNADGSPMAPADLYKQVEAQRTLDSAPVVSAEDAGLPAFDESDMVGTDKP